MNTREALASLLFLVEQVSTKVPTSIFGQTQKASSSFSLVLAERQTQQHNPTVRMAVDQMFNDP